MITCQTHSINLFGKSVVISLINVRPDRRDSPEFVTATGRIAIPDTVAVTFRLFTAHTSSYLGARNRCTGRPVSLGYSRSLPCVFFLRHWLRRMPNASPQNNGCCYWCIFCLQHRHSRYFYGAYITGTRTAAKQQQQ